MQDSTKGILILILTIIALGFVFYINVNESLEFLADPLYGEGLGKLCSSLEDCKDFCHNNMGRCAKYCEANPTNKICGEVLRG